MIDGPTAIAHTLDATAAIRAGIAAGGRFREESDRVLASAGAVANDPLQIVITTAAGGISGREAQHLLLRDHRIGAEVSTHACVVLLIGATAEPEVERFLRALHSLPDKSAASAAVPLPPLAIPQRRIAIREAFMRPSEIVPAADAVGRVSADALAAGTERPGRRPLPDSGQILAIRGAPSALSGGAGSRDHRPSRRVHRPDSG